MAGGEYGRFGASMIDSSVDESTATSSIVRIKYRLLMLRVRPGEYLVGRSRNCHIVIDDDLVSRRHAQLSLLRSGQLLLADLGSRNGVLVNSKRIGRDRQVLNDNDIFTIGSEELHVFIDDSEQGRFANLPVEVLDDSSHLLIKPAATMIRELTETSDDLDLIGAVAERALQAGHPNDAEKLLEMHLRAALIDAQSTMRASLRVRQKAFEFGLRLAKALGKGEWFDYAVDLLCAEKAVCSDVQFAQLNKVARQVPCVDVRRLRRYTAIMRAETRTMAGIKMAKAVDELAGQLERT